MITFRSLVEEDKPIITNWIAKDPDHSGMDAEFFYREDSLAMVVGDVSGPGLYIRLDSEPPESVRLHIQFSDNTVRSGKTMLRAWPEFKSRIESAGLKRMVFESRSPRLIGFCSRCFGFSRVGTGNDYELRLD